MASDRKLRQYLDANCDHWPEEFELYQFGNEKQQLCVFCDEYHNNYPVHVRDIYTGSIVTSTGTHACVTCAQRIEDHLKNEWSIGDPEEIADQLYGEDTETRKNNILLDLIFPKDVDRYYVYLRSSRDKYVGNSENNRCVICGDYNNGHPITGSNKWSTLKVPVQYLDAINGGDVYVCPNCEVYTKDIDELYQRKHMNGDLYKYRCPECLTDYWTNAEEHEYRRSLIVRDKYDPEWACPECSYDSIDNYEEGASVFYEPGNEAPRSFPMHRFLNGRMCYSCLTTFDIDLMFTSNSLRKFHMLAINLGGQHRFICRSCKVAELDKLFNGKYIQFSDRILINIVDNSNYEVLKLRFGEPGAKPKTMLVGQADTNDKVELIQVAFAEVGKLKENMEIW